jgi:hypothetical protein
MKEVQECNVTAEEEYLVITNQRGHIEIWDLKQNIKKNVLEVTSDWNATAVSHKLGHIFYHKISCEVT